MPFDPNFCDFCGKTDREVAVLVAGPKALICNECIDVAREIATKIIIERAAKAVCNAPG